MIPKTIHYIWLGGKPLPKIAEKCIKSWQRFCPDYKIKRWDETNLDLNKYQFVKDAIQAKKYAFASDVLRTEILYNEGGIYLDIDVEIIKPIDACLKDKSCVMGFETSNLLNPGLILASEKHNEDLKNILEIYEKKKFDVDNLKDLTVCFVYTEYFKQFGLIEENETQTIGKTAFYASEYFSPIDVITSKKKITKHTHSIHWYNASWYTPRQKVLSNIKKFVNILTFGLAGKIYRRIKS